MQGIIKSELIKYLSSFMMAERFELFTRILGNRTRYLTVVLEDIFQPQNASAVLRTCDCFGIQDVHIIENEHKFEFNPRIELGSSKWLTLKKYNLAENNTLNAILSLKNDGYRIIATSPHADKSTLENLDLSKGKTALVFGSELPGISEAVKSQADDFFKIPMYGFTESFNISVSAAIILYHLTSKLRESNTIFWRLTKEEEESILIDWLKKSIKNSDLIIKEYLKSHRNTAGNQ